MGCNKSKHAAVASGNTMKMAQRRPLTRITNNNNDRIKKNNRTVPVEAIEEPSRNGNEGDVKCSIPKQAVNGVEKQQAPVEVRKVENNGQKEVEIKRSGTPSSVVLSMEDVDKKAPLFEVEKVSSGAEQKQVTVEINAGALTSAAVVGSREDVIVVENVVKKAPAAEVEKVNNNGVEEKEVEVEVSGVASASPVAVVGSGEGEDNVMVINIVVEEVEGENHLLELAEEAMVEETAAVVESNNAVESGESDDAVAEELAGEADGAKQVVEEEVDEGVGEVVVEEVNAEEDGAGAVEGEVDDAEARNEGGEIAGEVGLLVVEDGVVEEENGGAAEEGRVETVAEEIELSNICETTENVTAEDEELKGCREAAEEDSADANVAENSQPNCGGEAAIVVPESTESSNTFETFTVEEVKGEEANVAENGRFKCGDGEATEEEEAIAAYDKSTDSCNVAASEVITEACSNSCAKEAEVVANQVEKDQFIGGGEAAAEVVVLDANVNLFDRSGEAEHEVVLEADEAENRESDGGADHAIKEPEAAAEVIDGSAAVKNGRGGEAVEEAISAEAQSGICSEEVKEATTGANKEENNGESETDVVVTEKSTSENGRSGSGGELAATEEVLIDAILVYTETDQFNGSADVILETDQEPKAGAVEAKA